MDPDYVPLDISKIKFLDGDLYIPPLALLLYELVDNIEIGYLNHAYSSIDSTQKAIKYRTIQREIFP